MLVLIVTGLLTFYFSQKFLRTALERTGTVQTLAMAHAIENHLDILKKDLLFYVDAEPDPARMTAYLAKITDLKDLNYCEFAYISLVSGQHVYLVRDQERIHQVPTERIDQVRPSPFLLAEAARQLKPEEVQLKPFFLLDFKITTPDGVHISVRDEATRLITPRRDASGEVVGFYLLSFLGRDLRNILSLYNSEQSPVHGFARSPEERYAFLFDLDGWIHFQSEDVGSPDRELSTYTARAGFSGTLGFRGLEAAFRPETKYQQFWKMVEDVRERQSGLMDQAETEFQEPGYSKAFYMPYAPVRFRSSDTELPQVVAGVAYVDKSRLTLRAGYKQVDVLFLITLGVILVICLIITLLSRTITRPIYELHRSVQDLQASGELEEIHSPDRDYETTFLKNALNNLIRTLRSQMEELRLKDHKITQAKMRERASLAGLPAQDREDDPAPQIIGAGPLMQRLKADIVKAAQVEADVLVSGETGSGKQLVAEAIHKLSSRAQRPFISINCGALDENLLLDTLFGHVKGAFTEARSDRNGAFLEANGGVLFLDEIQNATPKVQQALLRAISLRRFRPLGSDKEIEINVKLISATNVDLRERIEAGTFREDLYFRLKVISITTPPLRRLKENIPALARHFLGQAEPLTGKIGLGLTRGALKVLMDHDWPGNVRELRNTLLRAAVMAEGALIHDSEIRMDSGMAVPPAEERREPEHPGREESWNLPDQPGGLDPDIPESAPDQPGPLPADSGLNARQRKVLPEILIRGEITRGDYQALAGGIPARTALHDLGDLVGRGLLVKLGSGPSTRYGVASGK
jgi:DNA-binding NtrC family response regulator